MDNIKKRPWGGVKEEGERLADVPLKKPSSLNELSISPDINFAGGPPTTPSAPEASYPLDMKATNPLSVLPVDIQEKVYAAKTWYEIAAHPGATKFEKELAAIQLKALGRDIEEKEKASAEAQVETKDKK